MMFDIVEFAIIGVLVTVSCWGLYNVPILATGIIDYCKNRQKTKKKHFSHELLPTFSILVPVKNEEKVIDRLLAALSKLNYPADKREIVIIEDGSTDKTPDICKNYAKEHKNVTVLHRPFSNGKPSALNYGFARSKGEIVAIFDADNVPDANVLTAVLEYFQDPSVAAVQGKTLSINPKENMLTQFISYEEAVYGEVYLRGKDLLNLFVHLKGSCQFIRRDVLEKLNGFNENVLSEDIEISARLTKNNYRIRYAPDVVAWQESPSKLKTLFKQRTRWFRGITELSFKYGTLMAKLKWKNLDAEATLFAPFILIGSLLPYPLALYTFLKVFPISILWNFSVQFATFSTTLALFLSGLALAYITRPRKLSNVLWLPFVYLYWSLQAFIALYAVLLIALRRPKRWEKTDRTGVITKQLSNLVTALNIDNSETKCGVN